MKNAILFGANGYLGRHLAYFLKQYNINCIPVGNEPESVDNLVNYLQIDVTQKDKISTLNFDVDYIFAFAGLTGTGIGFEQYEKFIEVNEIGLLNILNHHKNCKSRARIIFPSTRLVYKGVENALLTENSEKEARTVYAQNKLACEGYLKMYHNYYGTEYTVFRICVPYGNMLDNSYSYGTIGMFLNKAMAKEHITLYGDGALKRTFTHVEDISRIIIQSLSLHTTKNKIYNIGSNDNSSLLEVAKLIAEKYHQRVNFEKWPENALKVESGDTVFNADKLKRDVSFEYKHCLREWISNIDS